MGGGGGGGEGGVCLKKETERPVYPVVTADVLQWSALFVAIPFFSLSFLLPLVCRCGLGLFFLHLCYEG